MIITNRWLADLARGSQLVSGEVPEVLLQVNPELETVLEPSQLLDVGFTFDNIAGQQTPGSSFTISRSLAVTNAGAANNTNFAALGPGYWDIEVIMHYVSNWVGAFAAAGNGTVNFAGNGPSLGSMLGRFWANNQSVSLRCAFKFLSTDYFFFSQNLGAAAVAQSHVLHTHISARKLI